MSQQKSFNLVLGDHKLPIDIHQPVSNGAGAMLDVGKRNLEFTFDWLGIRFSAVYAENHAGANIDIVGKVETSLKPIDAAAVIAAANERPGPKFRAETNQIELFGTAEVTVPVTTVSLLEGLTRFLLPAKPYLDLL